METNKSSFDSIHKQLKAGDFNTVIESLVYENSQRLNENFRWDANHAWYCVGLAEFELKRFQNAAQAFRRAYKSNPEDFQTLHALGNCYDEMKRPKFAERVCRKALDLNPNGYDKAALQVNLRNALYDQKRYSEAMEYFLLAKTRRDSIGRIARLNYKNCKLHLELDSKRQINFIAA
jgi:tetratricopeptide (TPR) repeat protein